MYNNSDVIKLTDYMSQESFGWRVFHGRCPANVLLRPELLRVKNCYNNHNIMC